MFKRTPHQVTHQITALGLSALFTLAMLGGVNTLFSEPAPDSLFARSSAPTQVVVIAGKRVAHS
jgi:hypothetical protein